MITLTAKINLISSDNATLSSVATTSPKNNISQEIDEVRKKKSNGSNPFILGSSILGKGSTLESSIDYFIGRELSDDNGQFANSYEFTVNGKDITLFTIEFDSVNNRHPNQIKIDGEIYQDDDSIFTVKVNSKNSHKVVIDNWNTPKAPLVILGIYINIAIEIDYRNLIRFNRQISYRSDNKLPSYGIISNSGNIEFNDFDGEIRDYAEQLLLTSDLKVEININNTLTGTKQQIGLFETRDWTYDNDNRSVSVSLKDDLEEWQDIQVKGFDYDQRDRYKTIKEGKMSNLYKWLRGEDEKGNYRTPEKYKMLKFEELDQKTQTILENTVLRYPFIKDGSLWEQWTKLCQVCGLYIYKNNIGKTVCSYTYGS